MKAAGRGTAHIRFPVALLSISALMLTGCGGDEKKSPPSPSAHPVTSTPPPIYTEAQIEKGLLTSSEVGPGIEQIRTVAKVLKDGGVPICSLSAAQLPGKAQITSRQFNSKETGKNDVQYTQVFARYDSPSTANSAFEALKKKARSCPPKQRVAAKKIRANFTLYAHNDTWRVNEDKVLEWNRLRGIERQEYSSSTTKYNVLHVLYDYTVRGNLVVATMYSQRAEPKKSGGPVEKQATEVLTKQLRKIG